MQRVTIQTLRSCFTGKPLCISLYWSTLQPGQFSWYLWFFNKGGLSLSSSAMFVFQEVLLPQHFFWSIMFLGFWMILPRKQHRSKLSWNMRAICFFSIPRERLERNGNLVVIWFGVQASKADCRPRGELRHVNLFYCLYSCTWLNYHYLILTRVRWVYLTWACFFSAEGTWVWLKEPL